MTYGQDFFDVQELKPVNLNRRSDPVQAIAKKGIDGFWTGYAKTKHWSQSCKIRRIVKDIALDDARRLVELIKETN